MIEFGSDKSFKYIRATVDVDQSSDKVGNLSEERNPIMVEETLFLKILAEGKATLYFTSKESNSRYFYKMDNEPIEHLIYKRYLVNPGNIGKNNRYKQQLATTLSCSQMNEKDFENLEYKKSKLIKLFSKYNSCESSENVIYNKKGRKSGFNLSIRPGVTFSSLSIKRYEKNKIDFDQNTGLRLGLEAEFILPFNNGKWSIFIEPTYRNYKAEKEVVYVDYFSIQKTTLVTAEYNSIEVPIGGRHYMFLNKKAAIFLDAALIVDATILDSKIESSNEGSYDLDVQADLGSSFGVGFKYKNKYSVEAQYHAARQILNYQYISSSFNSYSIILGYSLF